MTNRKGIILAGGAGTRLYPLTMAISKQLMPVYNKPMIYYPISVLMLTGIREIALITTPQDQGQFRRLLGDGSQWGLSFTYIVQPSPDGLAQAYLLAEKFLNGAPSALVLGDNIFFGSGLSEILSRANSKAAGGTVFAYHVADPERYGIVVFDKNGQAQEIIEKPEVAQSNYALTGIYFLDGQAPERAKEITPSPRGELEIVSLLETYLQDSALEVETLGRGYAWFDTGTHASLLDACNFVSTLEQRQNQQVACLEEIAYQQGWIDTDAMRKLAETFSKTGYGRYLASLIAEEN